MDIIQRAMEKKQHISKDERLNSQTWDMFFRQAEGKKIFLFGSGACADFFLECYKDCHLEGIVDNARKNPPQTWGSGTGIWSGCT